MSVYDDQDTIDPLGDGISLVRLRDHMGSDLSVVNAARVSFDKRAEWEAYCTLSERVVDDHPDRDSMDMRDPCAHCIEVANDYDMNWPMMCTADVDRLRARDQRLLRFLARHEHKLPFAHAYLSFEVYAPLIVARQWFKHKVGSSYSEEGDLIEAWADMPVDPTEAWNESSRRYVTEHNQYYVPQVWRAAPAEKKQGSGGPVDAELAEHLDAEMTHVTISRGEESYQYALEQGVAPEQARLFLPYGALYVRFMWSCSLLRVLEYLRLRDASDAQAEIQAYARAIRTLAEPRFPASFAAWFPEEPPD